MSIFNRFALGTANFGKEYNGVKVSEDDQKRILDYCQCSGIDMVDTAVAYEWDWTKISSYFNVVVKVRNGDEATEARKSEPYCIMRHKVNNIIYCSCCNGLSLYEPIKIDKPEKIKVIQFPYSIFDRRFERYISEWKTQGIEIHVRSIFLRGKILEKFKPWECIAFCLANPLIDRIIIGVDSYQQLKDNLRIFHRWESSGVEDENILDPRKWPVTCYDNRGNIVSEKEKNE